MKIIDISVSIKEEMPSWPGNLPMKLNWVSRIGPTRSCNGSFINVDTHMGTHIDAPLHFIENGKDITQIPMERLCGLSYVADLSQESSIGIKELSSAHIPENTSRLLIKTKNSQLWSNKFFNKEFIALSEDSAKWIVDKGIELVGIDYLSIGPYKNGKIVHQILLKAEVVVLEGLNLSEVNCGHYELIALPLKVEGAEGAPTRAILRTLEKSY